MNHAESMEKLSDIEVESNEEPRVVIEIDALRHGKKEGEEEIDSADCKIPLKPMGKLQALCRSFEMEGLDTSVARGSHKLRSRETAGIISESGQIMDGMAAELGLDRAGLPESLKSLLEKMINNSQLEPDKQIALDQQEQAILDYLANLKIDSLSGTVDEDPRLGFHDGTGPATKELIKDYDAGQLLIWMARNSDQRALETQDKDMTTYTRHAANIAGVLKDYLNVAEDLQEWMKKYGEYYGDIKKDNEYIFKRVFGTHTRVNECFLLKALGIMEAEGLVPKNKGEEILQIIPGGVKETEGLKYRIICEKDKHRLEVTLPERIAPAAGRNFEIPDEIIDRIIQEGEEYEKKFE